MPRQLLNEYLTTAEITVEELANAVDEITPKSRRILDFVESVEHDGDKVEFKVIVEQYNQSANIVGFSDSSVFTKGLKVETRLISPFHVKNLYGFKASEDAADKMVIKRAGAYIIDRSGIAYATADLERKRMNLMRWAVMSMLNDKNFTYIDGKLKISVPYDRDILDLTDSAVKWNAGGFDLLDEMYRVKGEFYANAGIMPNLAFCNAAMGRVLVSNSDMRAAFNAASSSDPETSAQTWTSFNYNGINWNILHEGYPDLTGAIQDPVDAGRIIFGVTEMSSEDAGGPEAGLPIKIHRCSNILNENDPSRPFYDFIEISNDPWQSAVRLYDNMIPAIMKKGLFQHLNNCL